jgi:hypothetical protein
VVPIEFKEREREIEDSVAEDFRRREEGEKRGTMTSNLLETEGW